jgi:hypothetical protein
VTLLTSSEFDLSAVPPPRAVEPAFAELAQSGVLGAHDLALKFFPVFDFQRQSVAALFCTPLVEAAQVIYGHKAFPHLTAAEWTPIDCAILEHTLAFAHVLARHDIVAAVGASVSFATLEDPRGRAAYREALRAAQAREMPYLVIKIEDIPDAAGGQRIGEIVASLMPVAPRVWVHLPGSHMPLSGHEMLRVQGLVLSMPARLPAHGMQTEARWLARQAQLQSAMACMDHIDTAAELEIARAAGVRFVAGAGVGRPALDGGATVDEIRAALYTPDGMV